MTDDRGRLGSGTTPEMRQILDLEDSAPDELFALLPGATVPFWAQVRMQIAWMLSAQSTGSVGVATDDWTRWGEVRRLAKGFAPSRTDAERRARPKEVLFYVGGGTLAAEGRRARNWLVEDFAEVTPSAVVVQRRPLPTPLGPPTFTPTLSMEGTIARARLWARRRAVPSETTAMIDTLLGFFADELALPSAGVASLRARVLRTEKHSPFELDGLRRVIRRIRPRVVLMDTASYTYNAETVGAFKDAGAYVVEPQHGWIGPSHAAYNYGAAFWDPRLRRALPDELITFGDFWSEGVRTPSRTHAIGKPHLAKRAGEASSARPRRIMVVSSRADPEETDRFVLDLRETVGPEWEVLFRPHPAERDAVDQRYPGIAARAGVEVDVNADVYESLAHTRVVVGVASTVLFEAAAFGCEVIVRDSEFSAAIVGDAFGTPLRTAADVAARVRRIATGAVGSVEPDPHLWAPDPVGRYRRWLPDRLASH